MRRRLVAVIGLALLAFLAGLTVGRSPWYTYQADPIVVSVEYEDSVLHYLEELRNLAFTGERLGDRELHDALESLHLYILLHLPRRHRIGEVMPFESPEVTIPPDTFR